MHGYYGDTPSEPDGCPRYEDGECECKLGFCALDDERAEQEGEDAIARAEYERDYPDVDWNTDRECGS